MEGARRHRPFVEEAARLITLIWQGPPSGVTYPLGAYRAFVEKTLEDLRDKATEA
jgi:hypothetical protein